MIGTLLGLIAAVILWWYPISVEGISTYMFAVAIPFLFIMPLGAMFAWGPMQRVEKSSAPQILELFAKDGWLAIYGGYLVAFVMVTFVLMGIHQPWTASLWIFLLGIAVDAVRHLVGRIWGYFNPFVIVGMLGKKAEKSIQDDREIDLCHWIDGLSEMAIKGIQRHSTSVCYEALSEEQQIVRNFFAASKSIGHAEQDPQTQALGITDKVSYVMFYLYQRLDVIFEMALKNRLEMTCSHIITILGKISIDAAKYDITMASPPLRFLGKFAKKAEDQGFEETVLTASCVFSEVAKAILTEIDITYCELKDPFLSIINGMEQLAKSAFQKDKTINISLLTQPFKDLKALFDQGKAKDHQDRAVIVQNIDRVLGEFEALQMVMSTMPKIPEIPNEKSGV